MKIRKLFLLCTLLLLCLACNLSALPAETPALPETVSAAPQLVTVTVPPAPADPTSTPTVTPPPTDLPFTIDCSALPASRQADCDAFIAATRDSVYPLYREVTGIPLSRCYPDVHYQILPSDPAPGAGGLSAGNQITYNQAYSVDLPHRYDVHELLHTVSSCGQALDRHVFHGMLMNYVYGRLGVYDAGYFTARDSDDLTVNLEFLLGKVKTSTGAELADYCRGILMRKVTIAYFDLGPDAVSSIYRSTIPPVQPLSTPGELLVSTWDSDADRVQALLETLRDDYKYSLNVPECGY
jgi:hypothetical protein